MKITAPLSNPNEIKALAQTGANELYCSVVPRDWLSQFGSSAVSRRLFGSLPNPDDLEPAITAAHDHGCSLSLVMNAQHYTSAQLDSLLRLAERFAHAGGDAVIIADPALLRLVAAQQFGFGIHLSSVASCRNRASSAFFRDLGATRIIFPRDMTLSEIGRISRQVEGLEFEAFILNDGCVFEEGVCHSIHLPNQLGGAICMDHYQYRYQHLDGTPLSANEQAACTHNDQRYQQWLWHRFGRGFSVTANGYPYGPCGLCALPKLQQQGIASVKIAGRDAPLPRKVKSVELVRRVLDQLHQGASPAACVAFARQARGEASPCNDARMCYYPEVLNRTQAGQQGTTASLIARG